MKVSTHSFREKRFFYFESSIKFRYLDSQEWCAYIYHCDNCAIYKTRYIEIENRTPLRSFARSLPEEFAMILDSPRSYLISFEDKISSRP